MRMKWKFPVFFGGLVLALAATAVSCSRETTSPARTAVSNNSERVLYEKVQELQQAYAWMGQYHTDALSYIYAKLTESKASTKTDKCRIATKALKEFDKIFRKNGGAKGIRDDFLPADICDGASDLGANLQINVGEASQGLKPRADISAAATSLMYQIQGVFDTDASLAASESAIYNIESVAARTLSAPEAGAVIGIGSIAVSSAEYWNANLGLWQSGGTTLPGVYTRITVRPVAPNILGTPPSSPRYVLSPLGKRILRADVATAISSLLTGWWMGAADLEASAVRAAAASATAAIMKT